MRISFLSLILLFNIQLLSQTTYFKVHDYDNSYNEGNILLRESDTLYSFGIAIDKTYGEFNRIESFDKFGNKIFVKNHYHLDGDAESYILKNDTIYLMTNHRVINGDTINLFWQNLKGDSLGIKHIFDKNHILHSPNPNAMIDYNHQLVIVTTSTLYTPENPLETFRNVGAVYFLNNDLSLDTILVLNDFEGTKAFSADIDSKGNLVLFTENRCGTCGTGGGLVRSVVTFDKDKKRIDSYNSETMHITAGRTGIVMQNNEIVFGFNIKGKVVVRCIDTVGNVVWDNNFDNLNEVRRYAHMQESNDGNILVAGETVQPYQVNPGFDRVAYLQKINSKDGFPIWERTYSRNTITTENFSAILDIIENNDNSLDMVGYIGQPFDLLLIKADSFGCINTDKCNDHFVLNPPKGLHEYDQLNIRQKQWYYTVTMPSGEQKVEMATFGRDSTFFDPDYGPDKFRAVLHTKDNITTKDSFHIRWDFKGKAYFIEKWRFEKHGGEKPYDTLLYDFSLKKGAQFTFPRGFGSGRVVHVDSIDLLDGYKRKRIILRHNNISNQQKFGDLTWIEGIGALNGIYYFNDWFHGTKTSLNCYYDRGMKRYSTITPNSDCDKPSYFTNTSLKGRLWVIDYEYSWSPDYERSTRHFFFADTAVYLGGKPFYELVSHIHDKPNEVRGEREFFRRDGSKFYFYNGGDVLLEDFNLMVDDTIGLLNSTFPLNYVICEVDTVTLLDGKPRIKQIYKCYHPELGSSGCGGELIEGLSDPGDLFGQMLWCSLWDPRYERGVRCYYEDGELVYLSPRFGDCITVSTKDIVKNNLSISPNPASTHITLTLDPSTENSYTITNISGQIMLSGQVPYDKTIDISDCAGGLYIIKAMDRQGKVAVGKFIVVK